jgi:predicted RNase H-like nuclease (RuvC/YqgF family)
MGVYFEYDFKNGKEVEKVESCYLCENDSVVYAEYYILEGDTYKLYKDARKIIKGKEVQVGSQIHAIGPECLEKYPEEEELISAILQKRVDLKREEKRKVLEEIEEKIRAKEEEIKAKEEEISALKIEIEEIKKEAERLRKEIEKKK